MGYIFLLVVAILLLSGLVKFVGGFLTGLFTLSFLPHAIGMFDGKITTTIIPLIGDTIGVLINILIAAFINIVDFILWFIHWIPGLGFITDLVYTSPDMAEKYLSFIFGSHRNFITHSVLNPIFIVFLIVSTIIIKSIKNESVKSVIRVLILLIGSTFLCHLLADTMPQAWIGFARIKVQIFINFITLPALLSKLWLYFNSVLVAFALFKVSGEE